MRHLLVGLIVALTVSPALAQDTERAVEEFRVEVHRELDTTMKAWLVAHIGAQTLDAVTTVTLESDPLTYEANAVARWALNRSPAVFVALKAGATVAITVAALKLYPRHPTAAKVLLIASTAIAGAAGGANLRFVF